MEDESDKNASRICHMCWMNKPIDEFMNRAQTRYCKICKTCRSGQLLRYYGSIFPSLIIYRKEKIYSKDKDVKKRTKRESIIWFKNKQTIFIFGFG